MMLVKTMYNNNNANVGYSLFLTFYQRYTETFCLSITVYRHAGNPCNQRSLDLGPTLCQKILMTVLRHKKIHQLYLIQILESLMERKNQCAFKFVYK